MDDTITSTILSSMNDGVIVIDFEGRIAFTGGTTMRLRFSRLFMREV